MLLTDVVDIRGGGRGGGGSEVTFSGRPRASRLIRGLHTDTKYKKNLLSSVAVITQTWGHLKYNPCVASLSTTDRRSAHPSLFAKGVFVSFISPALMGLTGAPVLQLCVDRGLIILLIAIAFGLTKRYPNTSMYTINE